MLHFWVNATFLGECYIFNGNVMFCRGGHYIFPLQDSFLTTWPGSHKLSHSKKKKYSLPLKIVTFTQECNIRHGFLCLSSNDNLNSDIAHGFPCIKISLQFIFCSDIVVALLVHNRYRAFMHEQTFIKLLESNSSVGDLRFYGGKFNLRGIRHGCHARQCTSKCTCNWTFSIDSLRAFSSNRCHHPSQFTGYNFANWSSTIDKFVFLQTDWHKDINSKVQRAFINKRLTTLMYVKNWAINMVWHWNNIVFLRIPTNHLCICMKQNYPKGI